MAVGVSVRDADVPGCPGGADCLGMMPMLFAPSEEEIAEGETEPCPDVRVIDLPDALARMIEPGRMVAETPGAVLILDYPLGVLAERMLTPRNGHTFTAGEIVAAIGETYRAVYAAETASQSAPTPPFGERGQLLNRPPSNGTFGIWGHDIEDLYIEGVHLYRAEGRLWIEPQIGS